MRKWKTIIVLHLSIIKLNECDGDRRIVTSRSWLDSPRQNIYVDTHTHKHAQTNAHTCTHLSALWFLVSRIFLVMMLMTDEAVARDHWEADSSKLGPNLEGIQSTVNTRGEHTGYYNLLLLVEVSEDRCLQQLC